MCFFPKLRTIFWQECAINRTISVVVYKSLFPIPDSHTSQLSSFSRIMCAKTLTGKHVFPLLGEQKLIGISNCLYQVCIWKG